MKTIKVIDLLTMIANKEYDKLPKEIRCEGTEYNFNYNNSLYYGDDGYYLGQDISLDYVLNDEVEIIEEPKSNKIEKIPLNIDNIYHNEDIIDKINEIIDRLNEVLNEGD